MPGHKTQQSPMIQTLKPDVACSRAYTQSLPMALIPMCVPIGQPPTA